MTTSRLTRRWLIEYGEQHGACSDALEWLIEQPARMPLLKLIYRDGFESDWLDWLLFSLFSDHPLYAEYRAKYDLLYAEYRAKRDLLYAKYKAKYDTLYAEYRAERNTLYAEYRAEHAPLYAEFIPQFIAILEGRILNSTM